MNNNRKLFLTISAALTISACQPQAPVADQAKTAPPASENAMDSQPPASTQAAPQQPSGSSTNDLQAALKKDMAYADLRKLVVAAGWSPVVDPKCKENVGDEGPLCDQLPEVESCSGDGYCLMHFERTGTGEKLDVTAYGMTEDWNVAGEDSRLNVVEWTFSNANNG
jgi:hypothetical protein